MLVTQRVEVSKIHSRDSVMGPRNCPRLDRGAIIHHHLDPDLAGLGEDKREKQAVLGEQRLPDAAQHDMRPLGMQGDAAARRQGDAGYPA